MVSKTELSFVIFAQKQCSLQKLGTRNTWKKNITIQNYNILLLQYQVVIFRLWKKLWYEWNHFLIHLTEYIHGLIIQFMFLFSATHLPSEKSIGFAISWKKTIKVSMISPCQLVLWNQIFQWIPGMFQTLQSSCYTVVPSVISSLTSFLLFLNMPL